MEATDTRKTRLKRPRSGRLDGARGDTVAGRQTGPNGNPKCHLRRTQTLLAFEHNHERQRRYMTEQNGGKWENREIEK